MSSLAERNTRLSETERYSLVENALNLKYSYQEYRQLQEQERLFAQETTVNREAVKQHLQEVLHNPRNVIFDIFETIEDFLPILESFGFPIPREIITHERAHWDQFIQEGMRPLIGFYFVSTDAINLRKSIQIFTTHAEIPDTMTDLEYFQAMKRVISAVKTLSESDERMLGRKQ